MLKTQEIELRNDCGPGPTLAGFRYLPTRFPVHWQSPIKSVELAEFENLWYITCAKIRNLYNELKIGIEGRVIELNSLLHDCGKYAVSSGPWRAQNMVGLLRDVWAILTNECLVGTLDEAVRKKKFGLAYKRLPSSSDYPIYGRNGMILMRSHNHGSYLSNIVNSITPDDIVGLTDLNKSSTSEFVANIFRSVGFLMQDKSRKEAGLRHYRSHARIRINGNCCDEDYSGSASEEDKSFICSYIANGLKCECNSNCYCRRVCNSDPWDQCLCKSNFLFFKFLQQRKGKGSVREYTARNGENYVSDAHMRAAAQMPWTEEAPERQTDTTEDAMNLDEQTDIAKVNGNVHMPIKIQGHQNINAYDEKRLDMSPSRCCGIAVKDFVSQTNYVEEMRYENHTTNKIPICRNMNVQQSKTPSSSSLKAQQCSAAKFSGEPQIPPSVSPLQPSPGAPRGSPLQRRGYVLAGGDIPFEHRPKFFFDTQPALVSGLTANKEDFLNSIPQVPNSEIKSDTVGNDSVIGSMSSRFSNDSYDNRDTFGKRRILQGIKGVRKFLRLGNK